MLSWMEQFQNNKTNVYEGDYNRRRLPLFIFAYQKHFPKRIINETNFIYPEVYSLPCQASIVEPFVKTVSF